jgi:hypothetical protein
MVDGTKTTAEKPAIHLWDEKNTGFRNKRQIKLFSTLLLSFSCCYSLLCKAGKIKKIIAVFCVFVFFVLFRAHFTRCIQCRRPVAGS